MQLVLPREFATKCNSSWLTGVSPYSRNERELGEVARASPSLRTAPSLALVGAEMGRGGAVSGDAGPMLLHCRSLSVQRWLVQLSGRSEARRTRPSWATSTSGPSGNERQALVGP